ncbi:hypothetical protein [Ferrovibrio sp.]|uniref:hypothetical protein n=1 Tax=Ferrovibrio sp. TaxID=1917215 RepID=UPI0026350CC0|nr:hypothetical protein [Ferrovibrio sp.]
MKRRILHVSVLALALASPAMAQTTDPAIGAYENLPPGEQKIARSLFENQTVTATGPTPMSLDQVAAMKGSGTGSGWGNVFKQMQADGLIQARNLGQVVSGHYTAPPPGAVPVSGSAPAPAVEAGPAVRTSGGKDKVAITTASGRTVAATGGKGDKTVKTDGGVTSASSGGNAGTAVQTASGNGAGRISTGLGKATGQAGVTTAGGASAGGAGSGAGKAVGRSK